MVGKDQAIREMIAGPLMSDEARSFYLDRMTAIAVEIGPEAFEKVVIQIIDTCERRPTIATFRRLASLRMDTPLSPVAAAWNLVVLILRRHIDRDGNGMAVLAPKTRMVGGKAVTEPIPEISAGVRQAVAALGGWTALADCDPQWLPERYRAFKELFSESPGTELSPK